MIKNNKCLEINVEFLFLFLITISVFSQKKIIDSLSKEPIPFVEMYSGKGDILGTTNYKGEVSISQLNKIKLTGVEQLYFNSNNYQSKSISIKEFLNSNNINFTKSIQREKNHSFIYLF